MLQLHKISLWRKYCLFYLVWMSTQINLTCMWGGQGSRVWLAEEERRSSVVRASTIPAICLSIRSVLETSACKRSATEDSTIDAETMIKTKLIEFEMLNDDTLATHIFWCSTSDQIQNDKRQYICIQFNITWIKGKTYQSKSI